MMRLVLVAASLAASLTVSLGAPGGSAAAASTGLTVEIEPTVQSVVLGEQMDLTVTVTNTSGAPSADLVVHLDITDPTSSSSVDPEDWTSTLSRPLGVLAPGGSGTVDWTIQPIAPGTFSAYAVAISPDTNTVAASGVLLVEVTDQRSLDPGGILPVSVGVPTLVGALLLVRVLAARRATRPVAA